MPSDNGSGTSVVRTTPRPLIANLDAQPFPDRSAIDLPAYLAAWRRHHGFAPVSLITARGCPYTCTWCSRSVFGTTHRRRSPQNVADEVEQITAAYQPGPPLVCRRRVRDPSRRGRSNTRASWNGAESACRSSASHAPSALTTRWLMRSSRWAAGASGLDRKAARSASSTRCSGASTSIASSSASARLQRRGIEVGHVHHARLRRRGRSRPARHRRAPQAHRTGRLSDDGVVSNQGHAVLRRGSRSHARPTGRGHERTDRDLVIEGRPTPRYYDFARRWMVGEVDRDRHWRAGRYAAGDESAASALVGRAGMALVGTAHPAGHAKSRATSRGMGSAVGQGRAGA